jgi:hypothetical protein
MIIIELLHERATPRRCSMACRMTRLAIIMPRISAIAGIRISLAMGAERIYYGLDQASARNNL